MTTTTGHGPSVQGDADAASGPGERAAPPRVPTLDDFIEAFMMRLGAEGHDRLQLRDWRTLAGLERVHGCFARMLSERDGDPWDRRRSFLHVARAVFRPGPTGDFAGLKAVLLSKTTYLVTGPDRADGSYRLSVPRGMAQRVSRTSPGAVEEFVGPAVDAFLGREPRSAVPIPVPGFMGKSVARLGTALKSLTRRDRPAAAQGVDEAVTK